MKYSKQREAILSLLRSTDSHPSADWIYENLRKDFPNISLGTVYRNLALLTETGNIIKIQTTSNKEHFDGCTDTHHHFVCSKCSRILDVRVDGMENAKAEAAKKLQADVNDYSLVFYGVCAKCCNNNKCM